MLTLLTPVSVASAVDKPNIILMMVDELGYFEPGFMGGQTIQTPNLDKMAGNGLVFRNLFAGAPVCAPTRACLLTGKHSGHTSVRVNSGSAPLRADEITIASVLKKQGYATGGFGKWGCGGRGSTGVPENHGFDEFFGYYDQVHAHTYYPPYLIRNSKEVPLDGNDGKEKQRTYSHYEIHKAAINFITTKSEKPFFAYLPYTPPHGAFQIPDTDPAWALYKDKPWPEPARRYAAMVTMLDRQLGEILDLLKDLKIDQHTLVIFCGDNGGADYFASSEYARGVHSANRHPKTGLEYRGKKGELYEGGLRIPFVAHYPAGIKPGRTTEVLAYFPDLLPTFAELAGAELPQGIDGVSLVPTLRGRGEQMQHDFLYWEFNGWTAVRQGNWRAVKPRNTTAWELYDVSRDASETKNLAEEQPKILSRMQAIAKREHEPAREGTFTTLELNERDRRAKYGVHDDPSYLATPSGIIKKPDPAAVPKK
jgi:arylsulfatase A-like enzyme